MSRGRFVVLEGGEGAGKTTQIALLHERLADHGIDVMTTREPGGTDGAEEIRTLLVQGDQKRWPALPELLLMMAARADHLERAIEPALARGQWVVCDRFVASSIVYQGVARQLGAQKVRDLHDAAFGGLYPDLTLLLDIPVEVGRQRTSGRDGSKSGRFEKFDDSFHQAVRDGFLRYAGERKEPVAVIDAGRPAEQVAETIWRAVRARLIDGR